MEGNVISVERVIPVPPETIFELVTDVARHPEIDGSGTVIKAKGDPPPRLALGSTFGMSMHLGINYSMVSTVIEFQENRLVAWQTRPGGLMGQFVAGRIWRYELEPVAGGTRVRESWDISRDRQRLLLKLGKLPETTRSNMEKTLERIEALTTAGSPG
jgi:uncharacterized protein YndB with AHSA1/START domain